jgi:hypothetical protein
MITDAIAVIDIFLFMARGNLYHITERRKGFGGESHGFYQL